MFAPKYNYWNNYTTEHSTYQSYPYGNDDSFQNSYANGTSSGLATNHHTTTETLPVVKPSDFQHQSNNPDYIKEFLEKLNGKEREGKLDINKCSYPTQTNAYEYPYAIQQNQIINGASEQARNPDGKIEMIKKSNFLSKFYKPDGTPLKGLWDSDNGLREQRTYKYDPKPLERRKNPRSFVPDEKKTNDYWEKRRKNNLAARKSREDRRKKEIEILKSVEALKNDNLKLKVYAQKIMTENQSLKYEIDMLKRI